MGENFDDFVKIAFEEMTRQLGGRGVISNFVVVAEVVEGDSTDIAISFSDNMTPWLADGMLRAASTMVAHGRWETRDNGDIGEV